MPRPFGARYRKYCNTCSTTAKAKDCHICVSPRHKGVRMMPVENFYIRHRREGYKNPYPTSYCRECMKHDSLARFRARKKAAADAGPTP